LQPFGTDVGKLETRGDVNGDLLTHKLDDDLNVLCSVMVNEIRCHIDNIHVIIVDGGGGT
jgi:hypothetical protein